MSVTKPVRQAQPANKAIRLDRLEHRSRIADFVLAWTFDMQNFHHAVNDVGGVAL